MLLCILTLSCDDQWKCEKCAKRQQNRLAASTISQLPGSTNSSPSQPHPVTFRNRIKIYPWNAEGGIRPKFEELRHLLINSDIDVLAVLELKLRKADKTLFIEEYATVRKDRHNILGSGLLLFIRTAIVFEKLHSFKKADMEILSIHLKSTKSTWLELYNVYLPNTSTQDNSFDPSLIRPSLFVYLVSTRFSSLLQQSTLKIKIEQEF